MPTSDSSKLWWLIPAVGFLVLIALAMVFGEPPQEKGHGNSYDASGPGFRAAYLILEDLGYPVTRSRRPGGKSVRIVLNPTAALGEVNDTAEWVRNGGVLVLGDDQGEFSRGMGIAVRVSEVEKPGQDESASGSDGVTRLAGGRVRVDWPDRRGAVWARSEGNQAFVTVYPLGDGEVWLLNRPKFLSNVLIGRADNAVFLCRMADELLRNHPGQLAFDEYFHGLRDRPGVTELLLKPPVLWVTLEAVVLLGLLLWRYMPRFGTLRPIPPVRRRSKEEFLDAMASLLERKGDHADAYGTARDDLARELEHDLGLPAGTPPEQLAREAERRRRVGGRQLGHVLTAAGVPAGAGAHAFVKALNELEIIRHECFDGRRPR